MLTKPEAMERLGCSARTIARYVEQGKLQVSYRTTERGKEALYDRDQVQALKESIDRERSTIVTPEGDTRTSTALQTRNQQAGIAVLEALLGQIGRRVPIPELRQKMTLTLEEAAAVSGLSEYFLRQAIRDKKLPAIRPGKGYLIRPEALQEFVNKL